MLHHGEAQAVIHARQQVLLNAYKANPERFVRGVPSPGTLPQAVWINPPSPGAQGVPNVP
jgi:hypothetical protein